MIQPPIIKPGVWQMPAETYLSDACCDQPSLNAGAIDDLIDECPRIAWENHPRLNPNFTPEFSRHFDIGKAGHLLLLEPELFEGETGVINAEDYKPAWAQALQREIRAAGKVPLLVRERDALLAMREALQEHSEIELALRDGKAERSVFAKDDRFGIWKRCRPDLLAHHGGWLLDLKIVISANPSRFGRIAADFNWHRRAAHYLDVFEQATGVLPQRYFFALISKKKPYLATLNELDFEALDLGRMDCNHASRVFAECLERGTDRLCWPGYRDAKTPDKDTSFRASLPTYALQTIALRHQAYADADLRRLRHQAGQPIE